MLCTNNIAMYKLDISWNILKNSWNHQNIEILRNMSFTHTELNLSTVAVSRSFTPIELNLSTVAMNFAGKVNGFTVTCLQHFRSFTPTELNLRNIEILWNMCAVNTELIPKYYEIFRAITKYRNKTIPNYHKIIYQIFRNI